MTDEEAQWLASLEGLKPTTEAEMKALVAALLDPPNTVVDEFFIPIRDAVACWSFVDEEGEYRYEVQYVTARPAGNGTPARGTGLLVKKITNQDMANS